MQDGRCEIRVIDSHTAGEPTRVIVAGGPKLGNSSIAARLQCFQSQYDHFRSASVNEPRGSDAAVGALLCEPTDPSCITGVIFFNNVGYLGMCGHGTIGVAATLAHLGRIGPGTHFFETPVGSVRVELHETGEVTFENVASYRFLKDIQVTTGGARVKGDVAWGGNWFFQTRNTPCAVEARNLEVLSEYAWAVRQALAANGITGENGKEIDHIEISADPGDLPAHSRNFVLCPGRSYDRSPCGTGTSAKLACLYADGLLREGDTYRQAGILGTIFEGRVKIRENQIFPQITGRAYITSEARLILDQRDPFKWGIYL
ncbi:MAG: proline racemase family protein [Acidobacteriaceae bacterium]|nr:proline racemase family protein [Acidobacteriaceae bacterium]MBV9780918.1 proline racemase family protein [Acidobacteriaceae bacterium]